MNNYDNYNPQASAYRQAEERVKAKMGFYWDLMTYCVVNGLLIAIYLLTSWTGNGFYYPWVVWPLGIWGIGLILNFLAVYVFPDTPATRQKMVQQELGNMGLNSYNYPEPPAPPPVEEYPQYPYEPYTYPANKPEETPVETGTKS